MPAKKDISDHQIRAALARFGGMVSAAAHFLGVSPRTLQRRLKANPSLKDSSRVLEEMERAEVRLALAHAALRGSRRAIIAWELRNTLVLREVPELRPLNDEERAELEAKRALGNMTPEESYQKIRKNLDPAR